jgi:hypothetical protein
MIEAYKAKPIDPERERELECIAMAVLQMAPQDLDELLWVRERVAKTLNRWIEIDLKKRWGEAATVSYLRPVESA